ncbi:uncharacterized protein METZ01_LOCUS376252, partial [marine metagenome]
MADSDQLPQPLAGTPFYVMPDGALAQTTDEGIFPLPTVSHDGVTYTQIPDPDHAGNFTLATWDVDDNTIQPLEADDHPLGTGVIKLPDDGGFVIWNTGSNTLQPLDVALTINGDQIIKLPNESGFATWEDEGQLKQLLIDHAVASKGVMTLPDGSTATWGDQGFQQAFQPLAGTPFHIMPDGALAHTTEEGISPLPTFSHDGVTYTQIPDPDNPGNFTLSM